jgi:hypothetical protein
LLLRTKYASYILLSTEFLTTEYMQNYARYTESTELFTTENMRKYARYRVHVLHVGIEPTDFFTTENMPKYARYRVHRLLRLWKISQYMPSTECADFSPPSICQKLSTNFFTTEYRTRTDTQRYNSLQTSSPLHSFHRLLHH